MNRLEAGLTPHHPLHDRNDLGRRTPFFELGDGLVAQQRFIGVRHHIATLGEDGTVAGLADLKRLHLLVEPLDISQPAASKRLRVLERIALGEDEVRSLAFLLVWTALWSLIRGKDFLPQPYRSRSRFDELVGLNELDGLL